MEDYITLSKENIEVEHICCAFSDKKCAKGYGLKKKWLTDQFDNGYVFRRLNARAKVFIEYGPTEKSWVPVDAQDYLMVNCFWVSGQYKGRGHGKYLLQSALDDAKNQGKNGLVTVVGTKKFHFMSDTKWLLAHGFETIEKLPSGFSLLALRINPNASIPSFKDTVKTGLCDNKTGLVVYYTNRCPFTDYYVNTCLIEVAKKYSIPLEVIKLNTLEEAQLAPSPATIFSVFYNGQFLTTDMSFCLESRFQKILNI